jgi:hypothetical protein
VLFVLTVSDGAAGGVTDDGLTAQVGIPVLCAGVSWHVRSTVPVNPFSVPTEIVEVEEIPGTTDEGFSAVP